jgi:shikimate dehydrogenase
LRLSFFMPALYGLIGKKLDHTFSPGYFNAKFSREAIEAYYYPFEIQDINLVRDLIQKTPELRGFNVTIPYKIEILPFLDEIDPDAKEIGAVNCVKLKGEKMAGYNTDYVGFEKSLIPLLKSFHKKALILGTGGASMAVKFVLKKLGISFSFASRNELEDGYSYDQLTEEIITGHKLIINTTPLGMFPTVEAAPAIPYEGIGQQHLIYDLIYNPAETKFLSFGKTHGASIKNGLEMLQLQAEESWRIWNGQV